MEHSNSAKVTQPEKEKLDVSIAYTTERNLLDVVALSEIPATRKSHKDHKVKGSEGYYLNFVSTYFKIHKNKRAG